MKCILDFGSIKLDAAVFETTIGKWFYESLPHTVELNQWGNEVYGPISINLGEENPVPEIPAGGLAYTNQGNYFCIFFGQRPAWAVEYIGQIEKNGWKKLISAKSINNVTVYREE